MSPLLAPILAQLVTLQLGDRTEARYTGYVGDSSVGPQASGSTAPMVGVTVNNRRAVLQLVYVPSLTLSPLNSSPRELYVFHTASASVGYRWRRTTAQLGSSFGMGSLSLRLASVQGPQLPSDAMNGATPDMPTTGMPTTGTPTTGTPTTGTPTTGMPTTGTPTTPNGTPGGITPRREDVERKATFYTSTTTLGVSHAVTKQVRFGVSVGMSNAGGLNDVGRTFYPSLRGYFVGGNTGYTYVLTKRDAFVSSLALTKTWSSSGSEVANANVTESWGHVFSKQTSGGLGAGLSFTRFSQADGLAGISVFPTFQLGISHRTQVARGRLTFSGSAYGSPAIDPLRALVDPRVGLGASIAYTRDKVFLVTSGSAALSLAPDEQKPGAISATQGEVRAGYQITKLTAVDTGARLAYQAYAGQTVIPITWAAFVGVTFGYRVALVGGH
jgi:hypothetical protein